MALGGNPESWMEGGKQGEDPQGYILSNRIKIMVNHFKCVKVFNARMCKIYRALQQKR